MITLISLECPTLKLVVDPIADLIYAKIKGFVWNYGVHIVVNALIQ